MADDETSAFGDPPMALFGFSKEKQDDGSSELVLAYLEDLQRVRGALTIQNAAGKEGVGLLASVDEEGGVCTAQLHTPLAGTAKGDRVDLVFMAESLRLKASLKVAEVRGSTLTLGLPPSLELCDRRKQPRARLNLKEGTSLTALTGLFEGIGLVGAVENASERGVRVRVDKAMNIQGEKKLPISLALVQPGQEFMLLKLNQLPKAPPTLELAGRVVYAEQATGGLYLGVQLEKPHPALSRFVASRAGAVPKGLPAKARRRARVEEEAPPAEPARDRGLALKVAAPPAPEPPPAPRSAPLPEPTPEPPSAPQEPLVRTINPLLRLKKRSRAAVLLAPPEVASALQEALQEDGYGRVLVAATPEEVHDLLLQPNLGFLFIDVEASNLECLQLISNLHSGLQTLPPVVMAVQDVSKALVIAAHRIGVAQVIVKPYALDEALFAILDGMVEKS
jgi:CheY-like chemotaxis protein